MPAPILHMTIEDAVSITSPFIGDPGVIRGTPTYPSSGKFGNAIQRNSVDGFSAYFSTPGAFSFEYWIKWNSFGPGGISLLAYAHPSDNSKYHIGSYLNNALFTVYFLGPPTSSAILYWDFNKPTINTGVWYHIGYVYDHDDVGNELRLYVDNSELTINVKNNEPLDHIPPDAGNDFHFETRSSWAATYTDNMIDNMKAWGFAKPNFNDYLEEFYFDGKPRPIING